MSDTMLDLIITSKRILTPEICQFEFKDPNGSTLPSFSVGAHIKVETPSGAVRSYSLNNDEDIVDRYLISVKREDNGRGGSLSMHHDTKIGDAIRVQPPENILRLQEASRYLLIAGGVGITPILPIFYKLKRERHPSFRLIYMTRSWELTAFAEELSQPGVVDLITIHHSAPGGPPPMDLWPFFAKPDDTHIYYCGPGPMMDAIYQQTIHWPRRNIHFENFAGVNPVGPGSLPFRVRRVETGEVFEIPADKTVVQVLREAGLKPKSSCESGVCGTCKVRLVAGEPDHRDLILDQGERLKSFIPCVSRALGEIVLDI